MGNIVIKEIKDFNLDFILKIKKLEIENLGRISGINEWIIPVLIKYGKLIVAVENFNSSENDEEDQIVGVNELIRNWNDCDCAFIHSFYVKKRFRKKGIGSLLLGKSIEILKKDRIKRLELTVDPENFAAIQLYEKFSFKFYGFKKNMYGEGIDRNIMACDI
ncbi:GNAT family N-acetyltransferase [bacterium]|nr:GNAT family N-acetyltransferase [bacterium]